MTDTRTIDLLPDLRRKKMIAAGLVVNAGMIAAVGVYFHVGTERPDMFFASFFYGIAALEVALAFFLPGFLLSLNQPRQITFSATQIDALYGHNRRQIWRGSEVASFKEKVDPQDPSVTELKIFFRTGQQVVLRAPSFENPARLLKDFLARNGQAHG